MIDVRKILFDICDNEIVFEDNVDLADSGVLNSFVFIELLSALEDNGVTIHPTQIDRNLFRTVEGIEKMIEEHNEISV